MVFVHLFRLLDDPKIMMMGKGLKLLASEE